MAFYIVEVSTASHDDLRRGCVEQRVSRVALDAGNDTEAVLVACQIASCTSGGMPTGAALLDFPVPA